MNTGWPSKEPATQMDFLVDLIAGPTTTEALMCRVHSAFSVESCDASCSFVNGSSSSKDKVDPKSSIFSLTSPDPSCLKASRPSVLRPQEASRVRRRLNEFQTKRSRS